MADPTASGAVIYDDDLEAEATHPWLTDLEGPLQGQPLEVDESAGNVFVTSTGPWWLDPNHYTPGAGYLNLLGYTYIEDLVGAGGPQYSFNDATFTFDINLDDLALPDGAHIYFWFQAHDYSIDRAVNYVLSSTPIETLAAGGGWTTVSLTLSSDDADWTALGSNPDRFATYGISQTVAHALASQVLDIGIFIFLGNELPAEAASGSASFDNFSLQLNPDAARSFREYDVNHGVEPLSIGLSLGDADGGDFAGGSYTVAFEQGADSADRLSIISDGGGNGIVQTGTNLYWAGQIIGTVQGGTAGSALVVTFNAAATLEAIEALGLAIGYSRTANEPTDAKQVSVTFADGDGGSTQAALFDLVVVDQTESEGDNTYVVDALSPANLPIVDEGGYDTIDATALTVDASIVLESTTYYPFKPKMVYAPAETAIEKVLSGAGNDFLWGSARADHIDGGGGTDDIYGRAGDDVIFGGNGHDNIEGGAGADQIDGGEGYDVAFYTSAPQGVTVDLLLGQSSQGDVLTAIEGVSGSEGNDNLYGNAGANSLVGRSGNDVLAGRGGDDQLYGGAGNDILFGSDGADILDGGTGDDQLIGNGGNDWYYVDGNDVISESAGGGSDRVLTSVSLVLAAGVHVETLTPFDNAATTAINITGNEISQLIYGNAGANVLTGGGGEDVLYGLGGDDWYYVDSAGDEVNEKVGEGSDRVLASASYVLLAGSHVEKLTTADNLGTQAINLTGNALNQAIYGNAGNNVLTGGGGTDTLIGLEGDDWFYVDSAGDMVSEAAGGGLDRVLASVSYVLGAGAHVELLTTSDNLATTAINLTGNALDQQIYGNAGANVLRGGGGTDALIGLGGDDWLYVDSSGDLVYESVGGGSDRVLTSVTYVLGAGAEVEKLTTVDNAATTAINLTGNEVGQLIFGNAGANVLTGGGGEDVLYGLEGDDWYHVDSAGDEVNEKASQGSDRVLASVSYVLLTGSHVEKLTTADNFGTQAINLTGNELGQAIYGNAGANVLSGGGGMDTLIGLGGNDRFLFASAPGAGNVDAISDFQPGSDQIALDDSVFAGVSPGALPAQAFVIGTAAQDADDRLIYDQASGFLRFDADGTGAGAAMLFATVTPGLALASTDFLVV